MLSKLMKSLVIAGSLALASQASALDLSYGDSYYLGWIIDGIPASAENEAGYINDLATLAAGQGTTPIGTESYNRVDSTVAGPFPFASPMDAGRDESGDREIDATGYQYVLGKYDGPNGGSLVWFLGGTVGDLKLPAKWGPSDKEYGLSHISLYNPGDRNVPDGGSTFLLLGLGLAGVGLLKRKRAAA